MTRLIVVKIIKGFKIVNPSNQLLGYSGLVQGCKPEPYQVDIFKMEINNKRVLMSFCECDDWWFRRRLEPTGKDESLCKHQRILIQNNEGLGVFVNHPIKTDQTIDPNFDWEVY